MTAPSAVVALAPEAVGLIAILLCFALLVIANILIQLSQHMPGPTGLPVQAAGNWLKGNAQTAISWVENQLNAVESAIRAWWSVHWGQVSNSLHASQSLFNALLYTATVKLPHAAAQAVATAESFAQGVRSEAEQLYNRAVALEQAASAAVRSEAEQLYNRAVALEQAASAAVRSWALDQLRNISADLGAFKAAVGAQFQDLGTYLHQQLLNISADLDTERGRVNQLGADLNRLEKVTIPADLDQLTHSIPALVAPLIGAAVGPLTSELARTGAQVKTLEGLDCLKFCDPLAGLGQALQDIDLALLLGLVAEAAAHPGTVERELAALGGELEGLASEVAGLVGVKV